MMAFMSNCFDCVVLAGLGISPSCAEYSLLKLRPGGPKAFRTSSQLEGVGGLSESEMKRLQDSASMLFRCVKAIKLVFVAGGHSQFEHPSGALSWRE